MRIRNLLIITACLFTANVYAQVNKTVPSKVREVTVFFKGAELTHSVSAALSKGVNNINIEGLSPDIDLNSLKIKATNNVVVTSYEFSIDFLTSAKEARPAIKKLEDSIKIYEAQLDKLNIDRNINSEMISYLRTGISKNVSGSEKGLGIDELMKTMDYFKAKSEELETAQAAMDRKITQTDASLMRLRSQLAQESTKGTKTSGILKLNLSAPLAGNCEFTVTYFTHAAGWIPYYDINITSTDRPIVIGAKSKVSQTTGMDWEKVRLTLSTAVPSNGKTAPLFSAWFLEERRPSPSMNRMLVQNSYSYEQSAVMDEAVEPETIRIRGMSQSANTSEPIVIINGISSTKAEMEALDPTSIKSIEVLKDASATALYGSRAINGAIVVTTKSSMDDYVTESDNAMNTVYHIDLPYTIPGNGKAQNIDLQNKETNAEYKYYCAPKLDPATYLIAEIPNWERLGLLSGKANITYDGTYIGETMIDASSTHEKLALTLGSDNRVAVKREKMKDFSSKKSLGSDILNTFTYKLTVKNNQTKPVKMVLKDQYPISTHKNIVVNLLKETSPWTVNMEDVGVITWEEDFAPGETKTYTVSYSVKYPKELRLNL